DANGNPKGVTLTVSYDNNTNSLIVACPTPMYEDIKKLVTQMDTAAADYKQSVKFIRVPGVDPAVIQQALDAIQGRQTMNRTNTGVGGQGGFGQGGFGQGGFGQGGGKGGGGGGFGGGGVGGGGVACAGGW